MHKNINESLPKFRRFKCRESEPGNTYLLEDLTLKLLANHLGIGCVADPVEATSISQLTGVVVVGNSYWARCRSSLEVGRTYEGYLQDAKLYMLPELKLQNK